MRQRDKGGGLGREYVNDSTERLIVAFQSELKRIRVNQFPVWPPVIFIFFSVSAQRSLYLHLNQTKKKQYPRRVGYIAVGEPTNLEKNEPKR